MKYLEKYWPFFLVAGLALAASGCTQEEVQDGTRAVTDTAIEHGPEVVEKVSSGDTVGAIVAGVIAIASAVGGYFAYRKRRNKKKKGGK